MRDQNYLFFDESLDDQLRQRLASIRGAVDGIGQDQFLISTDEDIVAHLEARMWVEPIVLHEDARSMEQAETQVDVSGDRNRYLSDERRGPFYIPGTRVDISIPFVGSGWVFKFRTNPYSTMFPRGVVQEGRGNQPGIIRITIVRPNDAAPENFKHAFESEMRMIREGVERSTKQVEGYNSQLAGHIRAAAADRRARLDRHKGIASLLEIPLAPRGGAPSTKPVQIEARPLPRLPVPPKSGLEPEPGISEETFEKILSVIRHEGRTFETTPSTFQKLDEEELRNIMLAHLNGHFQGRAAGEVFRRSGKTDIRIEEENRSAFVAECKVWGGAAQVAGDLDQLLGYLTWRDSKAALVVFNKSVKGFTELQQNLIAAVRGHRCFLREVPSNQPGEWRVSMRSVEDEGRRVIVHVFAINVFAESGSGPRVRKL